jgi:hypothetical protein
MKIGGHLLRLRSGVTVGADTPVSMSVGHGRRVASLGFVALVAHAPAAVKAFIKGATGTSAPTRPRRASPVLRAVSVDDQDDDDEGGEQMVSAGDDDDDAPPSSRRLRRNTVKRAAAFNHVGQILSTDGRVIANASEIPIIPGARRRTLTPEASQRARIMDSAMVGLSEKERSQAFAILYGKP